MSRAQRTKQYRDTIKQGWSRKFWSFIQENPDKNWDWLEKSRDPDITWDIIRDNPDKPWNWKGISGNDMRLGKKQWINQRRLQHIKAFQIQRHWRNCSCNPEFRLAQRCVERVYQS